MPDDFVSSAINANNLGVLTRAQEELRLDFRTYVEKSDARFLTVLERIGESDKQSISRDAQQMQFANKLLAFQIAQFFIFAIVIVTMFFYISAAITAVAAAAK